MPSTEFRELYPEHIDTAQHNIRPAVDDIRTLVADGHFADADTKNPSSDKIKQGTEYLIQAR